MTVFFGAKNILKGVHNTWQTMILDLMRLPD